jgi:hypothetical protein
LEVYDGSYDCLGKEEIFVSVIEYHLR